MFALHYSPYERRSLA